jgi:putative lipoprotein
MDKTGEKAMKRRVFLAMGLAGLGLAACEPLPQVSESDLLITARLGDDIRKALPADAALILELADVSLADAPSIRIAKARLGPKDPLHLIVPRIRLRDGMSYGLSLRIEDASGTLLWISDTAYILPQNPPRRVNFGKLSMAQT